MMTKKTICYGLSIILMWVAIVIFLLDLVPSSNSQPCVVKLQVEGLYGESWQGSGVFVADDLILTAGHMVEDANKIIVTWPCGYNSSMEIEKEELTYWGWWKSGFLSIIGIEILPQYKPYVVSWYQEDSTLTDLGFIYIKTSEIEPIASFDDAVIGETVTAIGNPYGHFPVVTQGIISAIGMKDTFVGGKNVFITDCPLVPGNSGCPIFDKDNNILGIHSWHYLNEEGMNFCVPAKICELSLAKYYAIQALWEAE